MNIFEKHPHADAYRVGGSFQPYATIGADKRFTDAELASEHWAYCWLWERHVSLDDGYEGDPETREVKRRAEVIERFATLPHYDDE